MTRVKVCGIKRLEDALLASRLGADAIGLLVGQRHVAWDFISAELASEIAARMPPTCMPILVTHLERWRELRDLIVKTRLCTIQLHGRTSTVDIRRLREELPHVNLLQAVHVDSPAAVDQAITYAAFVDGIVLDTQNAERDQVGGTGKTHDWNISATIVQMLGKPVILAGGLNESNVAQAIAKVNPAVVDANTSTKAKDGFKDPEKLRLFIEAAKRRNKGIGQPEQREKSDNWLAEGGVKSG